MLDAPRVAGGGVERAGTIDGDLGMLAPGNRAPAHGSGRFRSPEGSTMYTGRAGRSAQAIWTIRSSSIDVATGGLEGGGLCQASGRRAAHRQASLGPAVSSICRTFTAFWRGETVSAM